MLTFLAPAALAGALLLAIPVLIHLFRPRKMRPTPFSSLRWLRLSRQRLSRRIQWHQVLLLLLRATFILLLVAALAKPLVASRDDGRPVERFVILDVSRSMGYRAAGRPTPLETARETAGRLIGQARAGDRTTVLLTGSATTLLTAPTYDAQAARNAAQGAAVSLTDTDLGSAFPVLRPLLARCRTDANVELYFLTDNHQPGWSQSAVAAFANELPAGARVRVIDVGITGAQNAWVTNARLLEDKDPPRRVLRVELGATGEVAQERTLSVTGLTGPGEFARGVTIEPGRALTIDMDLPPGDDLRGQVAHVRLEPSDALPDDDHFFVNLDAPASLRVLLVEATGAAVESLRPGFHLKTAIESLRPPGDRSLALTTRTAGDVREEDVEAADVVFLAGVPELADRVATALEGRVKAGGGLVLFLGPGLVPSFYNETLFNPLHPAEGLLPMRLAVVGEPPAGPAPFTDVRWNHRLLAPLHDPMLGDLGETRCRALYSFASEPAEGDIVLARVGGGVPAVVERTLGAGKVLLFNTTANDDWSDLPRRKSYVPLIDRVIAYLSAGGARHGFEVGDAVSLPLADVQAGEKITVTTPGKATLTPRLGRANGRPMLRIDELTEAGEYRVERADPARGFPFVVNVGRGDSVLAPTDATALAAWWEPVRCEVLRPEEALARLGTPGEQYPLWPWLIALGAVLLLVETYFAYRLCPRANPTVAEGVVHKGGLLRPLT